MNQNQTEPKPPQNQKSEAQDGEASVCAPLVRRPSMALAMIGAASALASMSDIGAGTVRYVLSPTGQPAFNGRRRERGTPMRKDGEDLIDAKGQRYRRIKGGLRKVSDSA